MMRKMKLCLLETAVLMARGGTFFSVNISVHGMSTQIAVVL